MNLKLITYQLGDNHQQNLGLINDPETKDRLWEVVIDCIEDDDLVDFRVDVVTVEDSEVWDILPEEER